MSGREPDHAEFEPTPLAPRRRRVDPVLVGALIVVIGVIAAIVKPWDAPADDADLAVDPSASAGIGAAATSAPVASPAEPAAEGTSPGSVPPITWAQAATAIAPHDAWGVRAVIRDPTAPGPDGAVRGVGLAERWEGLADDPARIALGTADQGVVALGVTFPPDDLPLDVRIWGDTGDGWTWLDTPRIGSAPAFGELLFGPPRVDGVAGATWPTGRYRVDVLTADAIRQTLVDIPSRFEIVPDPMEPTRPDPALGSPFAPDLAAVPPVVAFVVEDGLATPIDPLTGPTRDLRTLWRDGVPGVIAPRANGIGVLLGDGASGASATLRRAGADEDVPATRVIGLRFVEDERFPYVIFRASGGRPFSAGVYRVDARWTEAGELREERFHLELRPGASGDALAVQATRAFRAVAGTEAVVGLVAGERDARDLTCADGDDAVLAEAPAIIGLGHPSDLAPGTITAELLLDGSRRAQQPLLVAGSVVPGLTLIAPANADAFTPGAYRLTIRGDSGARVATICAGVTILE